MTRTQLEKRIQRLYKGGTGMVKIGKTLGIGTGLVRKRANRRRANEEADMLRGAHLRRDEEDGEFASWVRPLGQDLHRQSEELRR